MNFGTSEAQREGCAILGRESVRELYSLDNVPEAGVVRNCG